MTPPGTRTYAAGTYSFTVTATSGGLTSSKSDSIKPVDPYSIKLCYGGSAPIGNYLGVTWSGNDGSGHHITFSGFGSTLDFSAGSGSAVSGAYNGRATAGDLNTVITWTDNGTSHTTRWGDANGC